MKLRKGRIIFALIFCILIITIIGVSIYFVFFKEDKLDDKEGELKEEVKEEIKEPDPVLQIIDVNSDTRPIAVMINNHKSAQPYQSGLNESYMVYEIVVEGGITRMLALFKDAETETKIGPIRSSRHYYLDYVLENNSLYAHHGWSPQAESDIGSLGIDNVEVDDWKYGFRDDDISAPYEHTLFITYNNLVKRATETYNYELTTSEDPLLNYSIESITNTGENTKEASEVIIRYSAYQTNTWKYNEETGMYEKYSNEEATIDYVSKEPVVAKNIITYQVNNYTLDSYGRQELENIGSGEGYYISNGVATKITWTKNSRSGETVYKYLDGSEIVVNDGITHIQIQPEGEDLKINTN